ncbi:hypothetical protein IT6_01100 [Methylacidiphilum caldifontis]|uniref:hypothetical protein n=1 Tax=Methylacidiphilum caldifontis TaxID=2795386 RepID=UPI001A8E3E30|nr:hypothetical protein [Methylacidiphilum caldifontis]QSR88934.1 hypothetical protein IT6_01100 [Methylacidiphilum caldifontis]
MKKRLLFIFLHGLNLSLYLIKGLSLTIGEDEGMLIEEPSTAIVEKKDQKRSGFFVAGFVGPQWIRSEGGHLEPGNKVVSLNNDFSVIFSPTFGYYWYDPKRFGHFSFTLELTSAYNGSSISVNQGSHSQSISTNTGLVFLFGTVGYRMEKWEPIIGVGTGIGILSPQKGETEIVQTALADVGFRYHWNNRWSLRIESFMGWLGPSKISIGNKEIHSIQYFSNNFVVGIGYALGK